MWPRGNVVVTPGPVHLGATSRYTPMWPRGDVEISWSCTPRGNVEVYNWQDPGNYTNIRRGHSWSRIPWGNIKVYSNVASGQRRGHPWSSTPWGNVKVYSNVASGQRRGHSWAHPEKTGPVHLGKRQGILQCGLGATSRSLLGTARNNVKVYSNVASGQRRGHSWSLLVTPGPVHLGVTSRYTTDRIPIITQT